MFGSLGTPELLILLAIVLVIFGASRLPRLGRGLGEGIRNFRRGLQSEERLGDAAPPDTAADDKKN
jgi:sec-independent protein translocase protein TatA